MVLAPSSVLGHLPRCSSPRFACLLPSSGHSLLRHSHVTSRYRLSFSFADLHRIITAEVCTIMFFSPCFEEILPLPSSDSPTLFIIRLFIWFDSSHRFLSSFSRRLSISRSLVISITFISPLIPNFSMILIPQLAPFLFPNSELSPFLVFCVFDAWRL